MTTGLPVSVRTPDDDRTSVVNDASATTFTAVRVTGVDSGPSTGVPVIVAVPSPLSTNVSPSGRSPSSPMLGAG